MVMRIAAIASISNIRIIIAWIVIAIIKRLQAIHYNVAIVIVPMTLIFLIAIFKVSIAAIIIVTNSIALAVIVIVVMITNISSTAFSNNSYDYDRHHCTLAVKLQCGHSHQIYNG